MVKKLRQNQSEDEKHRLTMKIKELFLTMQGITFLFYNLIQKKRKRYLLQNLRGASSINCNLST
jgi:hypothetical protein